MITAYGDAETKRQTLANGAEALLTKPIGFKALRSEIETRPQDASRDQNHKIRALISLNWDDGTPTPTMVETPRRNTYLDQLCQFIIRLLSKDIRNWSS